MKYMVAIFENVLLFENCLNLNFKEEGFIKSFE